ncbi:LLM class flavin-dependent oxidoreductase [Nostoc sp.]|uniref:LLM class flavin-dependent oxidoreductase n=1 Tax=Nostoc sp. TaxID=1180 RepID=UPI002FF556D3
MSKPRYGIWIPVYGNCGVMNHPLEPRDASFSRAKDLIQLAERCGFTTTLIAEHIINPRNQQLDQMETWTAAAALAEATNSIEIIAAVKPASSDTGVWYVPPDPEQREAAMASREC